MISLVRISTPLRACGSSRPRARAERECNRRRSSRRPRSAFFLDPLADHVEAGDRHVGQRDGLPDRIGRQLHRRGEPGTAGSLWPSTRQRQTVCRSLRQLLLADRPANRRRSPLDRPALWARASSSTQRCGSGRPETGSAGQHVVDLVLVGALAAADRIEVVEQDQVGGLPQLDSAGATWLSSAPWELM